MKERGGSGLRVGRMKEAAVGCLLRPGDVQVGFCLKWGGCTSFTFEVFDASIFTGMFSAARVVPFYT